MDTTVLSKRRIEKTATSAVGIGIAICLIFGQSFLAVKGLDNGVYTGVSPMLNYIKEEQVQRESRYVSEINAKYSNAILTEIDKGIYHAKMIRYFNGKPVRINIVELSTNINSKLSVEPSIATTKLSSKRKISAIAERKKAIVAINGGYFKPETGVPLGTLMIDKKIYTGPIYDRVAMGIFDEGYGMARVQLRANVTTNIGGFKIDNVNQPRMLSTHTIVYTPDWGEVTPNSPKYGTQLVISKGKLVGISKDSTQIPKNGYVIVGPEKILYPFYEAKKFNLNLKMNPEWEGVKHIVSGGPYLVKNNEVYVDMTAQKLSAIGGRNPRTAIGYTKDNNLIMLTADGREGASIGLTLFELASLMKEFGCVNAMNLDGGGSTVMYVKDKIVNRPAMQGGIPLSHVLTVSYKDFS